MSKLVQLKCKACDSLLKAEGELNTYVCDFCGSKYIFDDEEELLDVKELIADGQKDIKNGNFDDAFESFELYMDECGIPDYEAYLGYILSKFECRTIKQLAKVAYSETFEIPEWKTLLDLAGEHKKELLEAKAESKINFKKKMEINAERQDAVIINAQAIYLMFAAEYRELEEAKKIKELAGKEELFDTLHSYYIIPCTAKNKPAEFYLPAINRASSFFNNDTVVILPEPDETMKDEFIEEMYEYHMSNSLNLVLVFLNDIKQIERIYRYSKVNNFNNHYDIPETLYCSREAYIQGNQMVLIDGNIKDANEDPEIQRRAREEEQRKREEEIRKQEEQEEQELQDYLAQCKAEEERKVAEIEEKERQKVETDQRASWIRNKKCRHCGGEFIGGLFSKSCSSCGKKKDY